jgi:hypothetical protein
VDRKTTIQGNTLTSAERHDWEFLDGGVWEKRGWFGAGCGMFVSGVKARQYVLYQMGLPLEHLLARREEIVPLFQLEAALAGQKRRGTWRKWNRDEQSILDSVAESYGWDYAEENAIFILGQMRTFGELVNTDVPYAPLAPPRPHERISDQRWAEFNRKFNDLLMRGEG